MKFLKKLGVAVVLSLTFALPAVSFNVETKEASAAALMGTKTGYTKASDVNYVKSGSYVANWGARDEDCVFLSEYAEDFYSSAYSYEELSKKKGSTSVSSVPNSALYSSLQTLMKSKHKNETSYNATRDKFKYTDCVNSNYSNISSFYSGKSLNGAWDGSTWNREHTWPNSKGDAAGNGENDIMMLRPASVSENSSRGNKAYGESSGYYDPNGEGQSVRGDCARIVLYQYVRWNCTNTYNAETNKYNKTDIFGVDGVIQSVSVLLEWMEEDPVDTWEMGRNDAVQSITGTRNVFVDYPEYAWLLFGQEIPDDMVTPSGMANEGTGTVTPPASSEESSSSEVVKPEDSSSVESSSEFDSSIESIEPEDSSEASSSEVESSEEEICNHEFSKWIVTKEPTETEEGEQRRMCMLCGEGESQVIPKLCAHKFSQWIVTKPATETEEGEQKRVCMSCGKGEKETIPALGVVVDSSIESVEPETSIDGETSEVESPTDSVESDASINDNTNEEQSSTESVGNDAATGGCAAMVGSSMGGILLTLASCVFVDKMRKKKSK